LEQIWARTGSHLENVGYNGETSMRHAIMAFFFLMTLFAVPARADDYYNQKWFDFPTGSTKAETGCAHQACTDVPEIHGFSVEMHQQCVCTNPTVRIDLERRDVRVVVSGPSTADQAVRNALVGYAAGCVAVALAASTAGPQVVASPAGFFATFKGCIAAISVSGVVGGILNQFDIHFDTSGTHWSPL
jgi:hypothetical protein